MTSDEIRYNCLGYPYRACEVCGAPEIRVTRSGTLHRTHLKGRRHAAALERLWERSAVQCSVWTSSQTRCPKDAVTAFVDKDLLSSPAKDRVWNPPGWTPCEDHRSESVMQGPLRCEISIREYLVFRVLGS